MGALSKSDRSRQSGDAARFDAGDVTDGADVEDIGEALGGASAASDSPDRKTPRKDKPSDTEPGEATTSRLLRARRRAKRQSGEDQDA